jgi:hypothetical protein
VSGWAKVAKSIAPGHFSLHFEDHAGSALNVYGVTLYYVPAGEGWSDDEIAAWASDLMPSPSKQVGKAVHSPPAGDVALFPGQRACLWDATLGAWKCIKIDNGQVVVE